MEHSGTMIERFNFHIIRRIEARSYEESPSIPPFFFFFRGMEGSFDALDGFLGARHEESSRWNLTTYVYGGVG